MIQEGYIFSDFWFDDCRSTLYEQLSEKHKDSRYIVKNSRQKQAIFVDTFLYERM